jgi:uroporphyrinogen III methyltransferase/synthase
VNKRGTVFLVGAGPGAADLITVRGAQIMREADVVVYDHLAGPELLALASADAELIYVGKIGGGDHRFDQDEINRILIARARAGGKVVRLKGGDPFIFGRGGEEAEALASAGIGFEIIPGVTSAIAAASFAGIPLTHREYGSFVAFLTGHTGDAKNAGTMPWNELAQAARGRGTLVLLMGTARLRENLARLIDGGLQPDTPAAAIQWATTAAQKTVSGTLATLPGLVEQAGIGAPAVIVVGECARLRGALSWFERKPLFGRRIVITRAAANANRLAQRLRALGAEAIEFPTIESVPPDTYELIDQALERASSFDWIIFTSATGVEWLIARLRDRGGDVREFSQALIAAIGPATANRVRSHGLKVAAMPREFRAEAIIDAIGVPRIAEARILIPRAQAAREVLPALLLENGAREVVVAPVYKTVRPSTARLERVRRLVESQAVDLVTFTSSSTAANFHEMMPAAKIKAAAIGPITAATARRLGYEVVVCPTDYTVDALIEEIVRYFAA